MTDISMTNNTPTANRFEDRRAFDLRNALRRLVLSVVARLHPLNDWHRLNEHMLRDIGRTKADAEFEQFSISLGASVRTSLEHWGR